MAPSLAAGGLRQRSGADEDDGVDLQLVTPGNSLTNGVDEAQCIEVAPRGTLDFLNYNEALLAIPFD